MERYNYVEGITLDCPSCGNRLGSWQSKNLLVWAQSGHAYYAEPCLSSVELSDVYEGDAHAFCNHCDQWVEVEIEEGKTGRGRLS